MMAISKELEVKFYVGNLTQLEQTIKKAGGEPVQPRTYERNLRFDTPEGILTQKEQILRLRQDHGSRLTFKGPTEIRDGVSARTEIEFSVDNFENAQALFEALGYKVSMIYEKYRAVYRLGATLVTLDKMPFGNFAEIEGEDGSTIQSTSNQLGLIWELRTHLSYGALFEVVKKALNLPIQDLTFRNFSNIEVEAEHLGLLPADIPE